MLYFKMSYHMETLWCAVQDAAHLLEGACSTFRQYKEREKIQWKKRISRAVRAAARRRTRRKTRALFTAKIL